MKGVMCTSLDKDSILREKSAKDTPLEWREELEENLQTKEYWFRGGVNTYAVKRWQIFCPNCCLCQTMCILHLQSIIHYQMVTRPFNSNGINTMWGN